MTEITAEIDAAMAGQLTPVREYLLEDDQIRIVRYAVGLYMYCMERVVRKGIELALVSQDSHVAVDTIDMLQEGDEPTAPRKPGKPFSFMFSEEASEQIRRTADLLAIPPEEIITEACRLYAYVVPRMLEERLVFGLLDGHDFQELDIPGLGTDDRMVH